MADSEDAGQPSGGSIFLGLCLALLGAMTLSLGMVTQRFALIHKESWIQTPCGGVPRNMFWFLGLVLYGGANGFYAAALLYGPLTLMAAAFTTLLVFNLCFARLLLGEQLTPPKLASSASILLGVVSCVIGTPGDLPTEFPPSTIQAYLGLAKGSSYVSILLVVFCSSVAAILFYEQRFPKSSARAPPKWLDRIMMLLYPGSLGIDEGIAHLTMKGSLSMLTLCSTEAACGSPIIYVFLVVWICASLATVVYLRVVFGRYETTQALPVEYGTVNAVSACSGLVFFGEAELMAAWQLGLVLTGLCLILLGIAGQVSHDAKGGAQASA